MSRLWKALTLGAIAFLVGAAVYRAASLSITVDEAYTYSQFVSRPLLVALPDFDTNNHVLYTLLAKLTTKLLGPSDLSLRLPALGATAIFYVALYRLVSILTGASWWLPLGVALIGANTYIADLLPLARGYGLALALFTLALSLLLDEEAPSPRLAGASLGLSVAANLTFLFPAAGLLLGIAWLDRRRAVAPMAWAAGVASVLWAVPLLHASRGDFYYGVDSLFRSAVSLMGVSLERNGSEESLAVKVGIGTMLAAFIATAVCARQSRSLFLLGSSIVGGLSFLLAGHYAAGVLYPYGRTGIAWLLLCGLSIAALAGRFRGVRLGGAPIAFAALYFYARAWSTEATVDWDWDAGARTIAERIAAQPRPAGRKVLVAASGHMPHTLNYYRRIHGWTWLEDIKLGGVRQGNFDYYVLGEEDRQWAEAEHMAILYEHPAARSILATRRRP